MINFLRAGGVSTWFVLFFGGACFVVAALFAWKATTRRLAIVRALGTATVYSILAGVSADFIAVMWHTTTRPELKNAPNFHMVVMQGLGEAVSPAVLGFSLLAVAWLFVAVGTRRLDD